MMRAGSFAALVLILVLPSVAEAQLCKPAEPVTKCLNRLLEDTGTAQGAATAAAASAGKNTETGVLDPANGLTSSVKDFLPLLQLSGLIGPFQSDDKSGVVTVALNPLLTGKNKNFQLRVQLNTKGTLYAPLKSELADDVAEALEKKLTTETDRQNVTVEGSYNYTSNRFGREYAPFDDLLGDLVSAALQRPTIAAVHKEVAAAFHDLTEALDDDDIDPDVHPMPISEARRAVIEPLILKYVETSRSVDTVVGSVLKSTGLNRFGSLVLNRPQLHFSFSRSWRDSLYGPDGFKFRGTYEGGFGAGFNEFLQNTKGLDCEKDGERCLTEFQKVATAADLNAQLKGGARYSVFAEIHEVEAYIAPESILTFRQDSVRTLLLGATAGRLVGVDEDGIAQGRIEASFAWERALEGSNAKDRKTASITFTKKMGDVSIPFGLVWANRPEFLDPESYTHGVTARIGLKFNLFPPLR